MAVRKTRRVELLLLLLLVAVGAYIYLHPPIGPGKPEVTAAQQAAHEMPLDEDTLEQIRRYFDGIEIDPAQNTIGRAIHLHGVGLAQIEQGKDKEAYRTFQQVLAISYANNNMMGIQIGLAMLSNLIDRGGDRADAITTRLLAYKTALAMKNPEEYGVQELSLGRWIRDEDPSLAMIWLLRANKSLEKTRYEMDKIFVLGDMARALQSLGRPEEASAYFAKAWEKARALKMNNNVRRIKWETGHAYAKDLRRQERYVEAREVLRETLATFATEQRDSDYYYDVLHELARTYAAAREYETAYAHYASAYSVFESARAKALGEEGRAQLDNRSRLLVNEFVGVQIERKQYEQALAVLETNKARTLNDFLGDPRQQDTYRQWSEQTRRHALERSRLFDADSEEEMPGIRPDFNKKFAALLARQEQEQRELQRSLRLREFMSRSAFSAAQLETLQKQVPRNTAVISLFVNNTASVFLITSDGVQFFRGQRPASEIRREVERLRVALSNPYTDLYREPAQALYKNILADALAAVSPRVNTLVFSADDVFASVPLGVFHDGRQFLAERYALYRAPSLRFLRLDDSPHLRTVAEGIACVDPDIAGARLPFQKETGVALKKLYQNKVTLLAGPDCTVEKLVAAVGAKRRPAFAHIGAHGRFYTDYPMDSGIWIPGARDDEGRWNARAIATADFSNISLVTLSSCETGLTSPKRKRDVFGILRGLSFAGAKAVVAPLWAVHDEATSVFMQRFYAFYGRGTSAPVALQKVRKELLKSNKYRHPFYWGGFVLTVVG